MTDLNSEYLKVKDFSDLLETNIKFFKGEFEETYYYYSPWGKGEDQNNHAQVATQNLIELTEKYRIFTTNGQSSYSDKVTDQRSYLVYYMEKETFEKIKEKLLNDDRIWTIFFIKKEDGGNFLNIFKNIFSDKYYEVSSLKNIRIKRIVLTLDCGEPYSVWTRDSDARSGDESDYKNIKNIINECVYCLIVCKKWNKDPTADSILLEHFRTF
jgi:hypothetical protein